MPRRPRPAQASFWAYRLDRLLALHPLAQLVVILLAVGVLTSLFGLIDLAATDERGFPEALWWAFNRMADGGNVADDRGFARRVLGAMVTLVGISAIALATGLVASSAGSRLRAIQAGHAGIRERGHLLFLGWTSVAAVALREIATSGAALTVVIVSATEREAIEDRVREVLDEVPHRIRVLVRHGDPTTTSALLRAAAPRARAILILPEAGEATTDRTSLRTLLAIRRVSRRRPPPVLAEVSGPEGRRLVELAGGGDDVVPVEARDLSLHMLVHAACRAGVSRVLRDILRLDRLSLYVHPVGSLVGRRFEEAHGAIGDGVLVGLLEGRTPILCCGSDRVLTSEDRLLVISESSEPPDARSSLPRAPIAARSPLESEPAVASSPRSVLVAGYRPGLVPLLGLLATHGVDRIVLAIPASHAAAARAEVAGVAIEGLQVDLLEEDVSGPGSALEAALRSGVEVALLLANPTAGTDAADADAAQLVRLLELRRRDPDGESPLRIVVEVLGLETERLVPRSPATEFVLVREIEGMLVAQELHALWRDGQAGGWLGAAYGEIVAGLAAHVRLASMRALAGESSVPTFAALAASARAGGLVALGVCDAPDRATRLPARGDAVEVTDASRVVVLTPRGCCGARRGTSAPS